MKTSFDEDERTLVASLHHQVECAVDKLPCTDDFE